jgi:hypothetical protein
VAPVFSDRLRVDTSPSSSEPMYDFLDRVAGPVWDRIRQLIEDWANYYTPGDRVDVVRRLQRSRTDPEFLGAYWELFLLRGLKALGFEVTCHPEVAGTTGRPDFLVERNHCSFYLEAKILGDGHADRMRYKRRAAIEAGLNARVRSDDVGLQLQFEEDGTQEAPIGRLAADAQAWLDGLDLAHVRHQRRLTGLSGATPLIWRDERSGWRIALTPMPWRSRRAGGRIVAVVGPHAEWIDDRTAIRKSLYRKAHRYGDKFDRPFVVALGMQRPFADDTDVLDALFGDDVYELDPWTGDGEPARKPNGLLTGPRGPQSRRLSAVLVSDNIAPWTAPKTSLALWRNPSATLPANCDARGSVTIIDPQDDGTLATTAATVSTGDLFGLPPDWPGPEPPFPGTDSPPNVG